MSNNLQVHAETLQMTAEEQRAAGLDAPTPEQPPQPTNPLLLRHLSLYGLILLVFIAFFLRLWRLQVMDGALYRERAQVSSYRLVYLEAPRGIIYDSQGKALVHNVPNFTISIVPAYLPEDELEEMEVLRKLSLLLDMPITTAKASADGTVKSMAITNASSGTGPGIQDIVKKARSEGQDYRPIPIKTGVPREVALVISEQTMKMPGVKVEIAGIREYPYGPLFSQALGYVGHIPEAEASAYENKGYDPDTDRVGLSGIESKLESFLRGVKGRKYIEEDVAGREVRVIGDPEESVAGNNVFLSIDAGLQKVAADALQAQINEINRQAGKEVTRRGAVIAMNPQNGKILTMVSLPTYDDNLFTIGITQTMWNAISDDIHVPLMNHAIADEVPPGSIFKLIPASAALEEKVITPKTIIHDPGSIVIPNKYFPNDPGQAKRLTCWLKTGHGDVDLLHGLAYSCDVYFWEVGAGYDVPNQPKFDGLGIDRLSNYSRYFGLGRVSGIDIPGEAAGHVPTPKWKRQLYGETWSTGDTYNYAIGQGYLLVTPLQMLNVTAAVANGGTLYRPQVIDHVSDLDGNLLRSFRAIKDAQVPVKLSNIQLVQQGMEAAVMWGTSTKAQVPGVRVAGKTGTAEFCDDVAIKLGICYTGHVPTHAWFVSFAPVENPQIALIVYIWNGGEGSEQAVPVAKKVLDYYFGVTQKGKQ